MYLPKQAIQKYKEIHEREFNEKITMDEAAIYAERLIEFLSLIYKPVSKETIKLWKAEEELKSFRTVEKPVDKEMILPKGQLDLFE